MPGSADDEASHIPALLARQGHLRAGTEASPIFTHEGIEEAQIRLDESGLPYTWLDLNPPAITALEAQAVADPDGTMALVLDGVESPTRPFNKPVNDGGIRLLPGDGVTRSRMRIAADQAIVLTHGPLPCPLSVTSVQAVASSRGQR
jgi:preprotein translocase subunit SecD